MPPRTLALLTADNANARRLDQVADDVWGERSARLSFTHTENLHSAVVAIAYDGAIRWLAFAAQCRRSDDVRIRFEFDKVSAVEHPLPLRQLRAQMLASQHRQLDDGIGDFTLAATRRAVDVFTAHDGALGTILDELFATGALTAPSGRADTLAYQRDCLASAVSFTGYPDLTPDEGFVTDPQEVTMFSPSSDRAAWEDPMIAHDATEFLGWQSQDRDEFATRQFTDGRRTLLVANVNRWPVETALGADLLYFHKQRKSFVSVQYKRMTRQGEGEARWLYRPDSHFDAQLRAMAALDAACAGADDDSRWRMVPTPSFVKVCRLDNLDLHSTAPVSGMCMPRAQAQWHADAAGRGAGSAVFNWDSVGDYLTATQFAQLVAVGAVGTAGASTAIFRQWMDAALDSTRSAVVAVFDDPDADRRPPLRRRQRRAPAESLDA